MLLNSRVWELDIQGFREGLDLFRLVIWGCWLSRKPNIRLHVIIFAISGAVLHIRDPTKISGTLIDSGILQDLGIDDFTRSFKGAYMKPGTHRFGRRGLTFSELA